MPIAQLAYNSAVTDTTGVSPFYANYRFNPDTTHEPKNVIPIAQKASVQVNQIVNLQKELQQDIQFLSHRSAVYHNQKRVRGPTLKEGDKTYLLRKNFKTTRPSNKLDHTKLRPFRIKKVKGPVNYELDLPAKMRKHPVFHISLLEPVDPRTPLQTNPPGIDPEDQDIDYEVEDILDQQLVDGQVKYLVK